MLRTRMAELAVKLLLLISSLLLNLPGAFSQGERPLPPPEAVAAAPWWAREMYSGQANVLKVDSAYRVWQEDHPGEVTYFTRYYQHWRKAIERLTPEGYAFEPDLAGEMRTFEDWKNLRQQSGRGTAVWENIGPGNTLSEGDAQPVSWQANIYCLDQSASNPDILYAGTETGAIFKSTDKGQSWDCVSDELSLGGIASIAVDPANPDIVYFGEGSTVYKTTDGGAEWKVVFQIPGLDPYVLAVNPVDPNIVLLGCGLGLFRSDDSGQSWNQYFIEKCWDIAFKPGDGNTVYLVKTNIGSKLCDFYKSTDKGASWYPKQNGWIDAFAPGNGLSDNKDGGARLAVSNADPDRVYAVLLGQYNDGLNDNNFLGIYRSDDSGESWSLPNTNANGGPGAPYAGNHYCLSTFWFGADEWYPQTYQYDQGYYNLAIAASDSDADDLLIGFLNLFKSEDGAATFTRWGGYGGGPGNQHPDIQDIDINGDDVWVCSDGGINKYMPDFSAHEARNTGLEASEFWGFDGGWNEDILTGGRYHNGNTATIFEIYPSGEYLRLGGAEAGTGYVHPSGGRKVMHSDINPKVLPEVISGEMEGFAFEEYPNEGYAGNNENSSEIEQDPRCYNHLYMGKDNTLVKSEDGGLSWSTVYTFGQTETDIITGIEIGRNDPSVIYCVQNAGTTSRLWRSADGGASFAETTLPPGPANGAFIALSPEDDQKIWLAWSRGGSNANKVFVSVNGGQGWNNITTPVLNGHFIEQLVAIGGTDDLLYLATDLGVFYHKGNIPVWTACSDGLPARAASNRMVPFYAKGKVRLATYKRGIWQADFVEQPTHPVVQPTVDKLVSGCARDTFYFDDFSMVNHTGATWSWTFTPQPQFVDNPGIRNPKVVFGNPGEYTATLLLNGQYSKDLLLTVNADCDPETIPGKALALSGEGQYAVSNGNLNLNANTVTLTAWIKPQGPQNDWAGILFARGGNTTAGLSIRDNNKLAYHWNDSGWWWDSGLTVPSDTWTHVALVITPANAKIYLNGVPATHNETQEKEQFDTPLNIGVDPNGGDRYFKGLIDEVNVWKTALSQAQIRELMHLTRKPAEQPGLVAYYQFNEEQGQANDRVGVRHVSLAGGATRTASTAPVGDGVSARNTVDNDGIFTFGSTGITLEFGQGAQHPNGELCVSRLNLDPDQLPDGNPHSRSYWIVNNYGANQAFDPLKFIRFEGYGPVPAGAASGSYRLYERASFADGPTWGAPLDYSDFITPGDDGTVEFFEGNGVTALGQFMVTQDLTVATTEPGTDGWSLFPNPLKFGRKLTIRPDFDGKYNLSISDATGKVVLEKSLQGDFELPEKALQPGAYSFTLVGPNRRLVGKIVVIR